ncbi:capsular biosynthesis protein [Pantoea sp. EA-12]|uniref:capsular polysaccharide export protein, LipB/KpsS family n=1 Tax=Pantoea sp. EA-12 TaxID=3043303 RepID=UPI0024B59154|nr:capsular biosynthesis protein [Pantoea sp. EA-12]MDI9221129.1 capsular biosynthesis protein [Pantoea sp. EA-12]
MLEPLRNKFLLSIYLSKNIVLQKAFTLVSKHLSLRSIKSLHSQVNNIGMEDKIHPLLILALNRFPNNKFAHIELKKLNLKDSIKTTATLKSRIEKRITKKTEGQLDIEIKHAVDLIEESKINQAFSILTNLQKKYPSERKILMRLGEIYQNDKKIIIAHNYFKAAQNVYPEYGTVRKLSFEIDNGLYNDGFESLKAVLNFPILSILKFLPVINRASVYYPEINDLIIEKRVKVKTILNQKKGKKGTNPTEQAKIAIRCRWLEIAANIISRNEGSASAVSSSVIEWLNAAQQRTNEIFDYLNVATLNDENLNNKGYLNGELIDLNDPKYLSMKKVELFLPSVIFSNPSQEKSSYSTVRDFYQTVIEVVFDLKNAVIIPRNQWNWRKCNPFYYDSYVISYHTVNPLTNPGWISIQESTISGRCSIDKNGFAGFSSISEPLMHIAENNFDATKVKDNDNFITNYIKNNTSKYNQSDYTLEADSSINYPYVFLALQVTTDIVASLAYIDGYSLLEMLAEYYKDKDEKLVVKRHPYCKSASMERLINKLSFEGLIIVSENSVHNLINKANLIFTVNSGVGLEAILHNKRVINTGRSDYDCCTYGQATNFIELISLIESDNYKIENEKRDIFLDYYLNHYALYPYEKDKIQYQIESLLKMENDE